MKKTVYLLVLSLLAILPLSASQMQVKQPQEKKFVPSKELQILNPVLVFDTRKSEIIHIKNKLHALVSVKITLFVYNAGDKTIRFPTSVTTTGMKLILPGKATKELPEGTLLTELVLCRNQALQEKKTGRKIPLVRPESAFGIAELRPGEAVVLSTEAKFPKENLEKIKKVRFLIFSDPANRYSFWQGVLMTQDYSFPDTQTFRILK